MRTGITAHILRGYLTVARVAGFFVAVVLGAAAAGAAIAVPLWLFATHATLAYNWFVVAACAGAVLGVVVSRVVRGARRALDRSRYLRRLAVTALGAGARTLAVVALVLGEFTVFARWGTVPGLIVLPVAGALAGVALFVPWRARTRDRERPRERY